MANVTYENVTPALIENTTMQKVLFDGVHRAYYIAPVDGYVLHDKALDWTEVDENTFEETAKQGYTGGTVSCGYNYDFTANSREFFTVPESEVPADQIFGGGNDHEVM